MNKIFKVVWSKTKECYVVVSEVAKNNGGKKKVLASVLAGLAMVATGTMGTPVQAGTDLGNSSVNISPNGTYNGSNTVGSNSIVVGFQNTTNNQWGTVAIGAANTATENSAVAVGNGNTASGGAAAAFGAYNQATGRASVAIGNVSMASGEDSIAIGNRANSNSANQDLRSGQFSIAMGRESWARGTDNISIGHNAKTDSSGDSIAIGRDSTSNSVNTVTIGAQTRATGGYAVAIGRESEVNANFATAMGYQSKAKGSASIAIGKQNNSNLGDTITMGNKNTANTMGGIAIGKNNIADSSIGDPTTANKENSQIAIGLDNKATSQDTVAIGREAESTKTGAVSLGARTKAKGDYAVALGSASENKTVEAADYAVAVGAMSKATGDRSVAIGGGAEASASRAVAHGYRSSASVADGVALGSNSKATVDKGVKGFNPAETRTNKYDGLAGNVQTSTLAAVSVGDGDNATRQITGLAAGTANSDAVNVAQLRSVNLKYAGDSGNGDVLLDNGTLKVKGSDFITTSADGTGVKIEAKIGQDITANADGKAVAPTTNGIATTDNVTQAINNSGWKVTSSNNGGTTNGSSSEKVSPGDKVTFSAGKNIVLDQAGKQFTYSLNKDVDLTKDGSLTIGDTKIVNDGLTITGGPSITKTGINAGSKKITNVAAGTDDTDAVNVKQLKDTEKHIKPGTYAVANDGSVTLKYVDGNGTEQTETAKITGIAKKSKVINGQNTTVEEGTDTTDNSVTYKVNVKGDLADISSITNGTGSGKISFAGNQVVTVDGDHPISLDGKGGYVTGLQNKDWDITNPTVVSGRAATEDQLKKVSDGFNNTVKLAGNTGNTDTQKLNKTGGLSFGVVGADNGKYIKTSASGSDVVADLSDDAKAKLNKTYTVSSGSQNVTVTPTTVGDNTDFKITVAGTGTTTSSSWNLNSGVASTTEGTHAGDTTQNIADTKTVTMQAGKNLTVKQTNDGNGNTSVAYSLDKDLTNLDKVVVNGKDGVAGKDGVTIVGPQGATGAPGIPGTNGIDGKVGISGKDGKDAVSIAGKDGVGTIGLTGPQGPAGADGKGVDISTDHGTQTLVKQEAHNDNKSERIVYVPKDKDGNPLKDGDGNTIKREVATMDDGLKFKGDNATVIKKPLGEQLDIIGGATGSLSDNNIGVNEDNGKLKVQLAKTIDLTKDGSVTTGNTKVDNSGITITAPTGGTTTNVSLTQSGLNNGGNKIVNVKEGTADTDAVNVKQLKDAKTVLVDGKNTKKEGSGTAADPYKVNVEGALVDISSITNGNGSGKLSFGPNQTVTVDGDHSITLNAKTGKIGGLQNKTFDPNNFTSGQAATEDQLKSVHDTLKASELHIAPTTGTTEDKGGTASGSTNVYKYDATNKTVTLTYNDGNGQAVSGPKAVIDFSALNVTSGNNYGFNTNAGGNLTTGTTASVKPVASGKTVTYAAGKNLTVEQKETNGDLTYTYALDKDLTNLDKIVVNGKDGQPGHDGVTITGPQGTAGVDGNNGKVGISGTDGKDAVSISGKDGVGHIGLTGPAGKDGKDATADITVKDGVPGVDGAPGDSMTRIVYKDKDGKDHEVATHDDGMKFAGDNGQTNQDTNPNVIKKHLNNVVDIIGGATGTLTDNNIGVNADNGKLKVQLAKDINLTKDGSLTIGGTKVDGNGLTITGGPSVTKTGIDAGNKAITNVANGTNDSDAVNVSQLKGSITTVKSSDGSITVTDANAGSTDPTKGHAYDIKVNNQGVVNNAQLPVEYTKADGTKVYKQPNGSFNTAKDGSGIVVNAGDVIASMNNGSDSTTAPMKLANVGSSIAGQSGTTYLDKINAAASNPNTTNNAVNVSDLKDTAKAIGDKGLNFGAQSGADIHKNLGEKLEIVGGGQKADSEYDASNIKTMTKDGKVVVALDKNIKADTVTVGKDGKDGVDGKIGVNGKDGASVTINGKDGSIGLQGPKGADGKDGASATIKVKDGVPGVDGKDGETLTRIVYETKDGVEHQVATHDDGLKFTGNNTSTVNKHHLNSLVKVQGEGVTEAQSTSFQSAAGNINVKANGTDTLEVQLNKDLKGINSIRNSATGPAMAFNTGDIAISGGNLNMGDNKITNVGPGTDGTDAVNLNQLKAARTVVTSKDGSVTVTPNENQATHEMTYDLKVNGAHDPRVDQLNEEIGRVGAQGAALAALKPIQYDPLEPTQIMAGYGNYRGNSALAVGVAHYKNESTMLHAGMSWAGGSSHMMANAGVTWKFGNRDAENAIADRYRKGPISAAYALQNEMAAVKAQNAGLKSEVSDLKAENQQMKAQIAAMMAKLGL